MKLSTFIQERSSFFIVNLFLYVLIAFLLYSIYQNISLIVLLFLVWFVPIIVWFTMEYNEKRKFYNSLLEGYETLDQKYLLHEIIEESNFQEGQLIHELLRDTNRYMHEQVNVYKQSQQEYREYIEAWVHEIKTPIAASKLIIENGTDIKEMSEELNRVEDFIEQVLYYARGSQVSKDYIVREFPLRSIVTKVVQRNAKSFIYKKIQLQLEDIDDVVYSDAKWVEFILNQIVVNAINYSLREERKIKIYTKRHEYNIVLTVEDTGVGIAPQDINRVFHKGFTGENGRMYRKSTGMGMYICKNLANKLHLGLTIESEQNVGTRVHLTFPTSKVALFETKK